MKYQVLETFKVKTSRGEMQLQRGQVITIPHDKAIRLLNESRIIPVEKVAYKVYSELLETYLWVVDTDKDITYIRDQGNSEAIYTIDEIEKLKVLDKDAIRGIHKVKEVFKESKVEDIRRKS